VFYYSVVVSVDTIQTQVTANPFLNGLPIFNDQQLFIFFNGIFSPSRSYLMVEVAANNDTTGNQSLPHLRSAFLQHVSEATISGGSVSRKPLVPSPAAYLTL
jgi:hypothetical protein